MIGGIHASLANYRRINRIPLEDNHPPWRKAALQRLSSVLYILWQLQMGYVVLPE